MRRYALEYISAQGRTGLQNCRKGLFTLTQSILNMALQKGFKIKFHNNIPES